MDMENIKKYKWLPIVVLVVSAGVFSFFCRFYHNDVKALENFLASYEKFDKAISDFSISKTGDLESKAGDALSELNTKATFRISSLIKNDAKLMDQAREIADLSGKELDSLRVYKGAIQSKNADLDGLAKEYGDLTSKRKAAYARFRELGGLKD
jgi:hypothetical protein